MGARSVVLGVVGLLALAPEARAQELGFLSGIFGKAHNLALYLNTAGLKNKDVISTSNSGCITGKLCGAGVELLLDLSSPESSKTHVELGFAASYLRGFHATANDIAIKGALRSFPVISAYITDLSLFNGEWLSPYVGLSFGMSDIWNGRIYSADSTPVSMKGSTFEYGPTLGTGIFLGESNWNTFIEFGLRVRRFSGLEYGVPDKAKGFPRDLDATGFFVNAGIAFDLRDPEKQPPAYVGSWILSKVNGLPLPGTISQAREPVPEGTTPPTPAPIKRIELVRATLDLTTNPQCFIAEFQTRELRFEGPVQVSALISKPILAQGRWTEDTDGVVELREAAPCPATAVSTEQVRRVVRENDEIVWHKSPAGEATLHFVKVKR